MSIFDSLIVQPIFNLLMAIYALIPGGDFGVAVVIFTVLTRFLMWPLVKKQLHQAKAMRKMQPEMMALRKKYKNDRQRMGLAVMELYKKYNISPFGSIGVLLVQLPVLIAIYSVVQIFVLRRGEIARYTYDFMEQLPGVRTLIDNPDSFNQNFLGVVDLTKHAVSNGAIVVGLLVLALIAAALQYFLAKQLSPQSDSTKRLRDILAEAGDGKEADQAEINAIVMRKMMKVMPVMLFFIMISLPGALALYMATNNAVAYLQNRAILKDDVDEMMRQSKPATGGQRVPAARQRAAQASEARVTRIKAKD